MNAFLPLLIIIISFMFSASKNKNKKTRQAMRRAGNPQQKQRPAAARAQENADIPVAQADDAEEFPQLPFAQSEMDLWDGQDGSIEMPAIEAHTHEGKPMPCPAEEREKPRPRPSQLAPARKAAKARGLQLNFAANSVVQSVVTAEILKRPEFKNGRRVIR